MSLLLNPFTNRGAVTDPERFFGRAAELDDILTRLRGMQSTSVVGPRRIGKSSLLYNLAETGTHRLGDARYCFCYCDVAHARFHTANGFFQTVLQRLALNADAIRDDKSHNRNLIAFTDELEKLTQQGRRVVLCCDEFEAVFKHPDQFGEDFFDHLRSELNLGKFAFVTASQHTLQQLSLAGTLASPFYNIFTSIELGEFTEDEALQFVAFYHAELNFSPEELGFIYTYLDHHPLKLQILCDWTIGNRQRRLDNDALVKAIEREYGNFFAGTLQKLHKTKKVISLDNITKLLAALKAGRDLISGK